MLFHTWNSEENGFVLHLIFLHRRAPGHFFSKEPLIFRIELMDPPHTLLEIAVSDISKLLINEAAIQRLNIPNKLKPLIRSCWQRNHLPVSP